MFRAKSQGFGCLIISGLVAILLLALAAPVADAQAADGSTTPALDFPLARTDDPRETLASFLRLKQRLEHALEDYTEVRNKTNYYRVRQALRISQNLFDLSRVPAAAREEFGQDAVVAMLDIFGRIELPPVESVPSAGSFDGRDAMASWRIPTTPLRIGQMSEGPREGEFLFTARTAAIAPTFRQQVWHLPPLDSARVDSFSRIVPNITGPSLPAKLRESMPLSLKKTWLGTPIWKEVLVLLLSVVALMLLVVWHRLVIRLAAGSRVKSYAVRMLTPIAIFLVATILRPYLSDEVDMSGEFARGVQFTGTVIVSLAGLWFFWLAVRVVVERCIQLPRFREEGLDAKFLRLIGNVVGVIGIVLIAAWGLNHMGVPAFSVLAGLGIGGIAVAIAIQPFLANLLASMTLLSEKAIRVGDFVQFAKQEGYVESIGVRSTQIRARNKTLITVPNSKLVDMELTSWGHGDSMEIKSRFSLSDLTSIDQLRWVMTKLREILCAHPKVERDTVRVHFTGFSNSGLELEVRIFALTMDRDEYFAIREDVLLKINEIVSMSGSEFEAQAPHKIFQNA